MNKIYEDEHGLYIKSNGSICRPIFPYSYSHSYKDGTSFIKGDKVNSRAIIGSPLVRLTTTDIKETWFSHGTYFDENEKPISSSSCFKPNDFRWTRPSEDDQKKINDILGSSILGIEKTNF